MSTSLNRLWGALVAATLVAVGLVAAAPAQAASTPPWETGNANAVGTISFRDANGNVITSGNSDVAPFSAYAVGSNAIEAGDVQAGLIYAAPDPNKSPAVFPKKQVGLFTNYPVTAGSAPASVKSLPSTTPVVTEGPDDSTLDNFYKSLSAPVTDPTSPYYHAIQIRIRTADANGQESQTYLTADLKVDTATHTWTQIYPQVASATPPGAPTQVTATAKILSANVTWTAPTQNGGSAITGYQVEYSKDQGASFTAVQENSTATAATVTGLTAGTSYVFRVEAENAAGIGAPSQVSGPVTPTAPTLASAPTNVTAKAGNATSAVNWFAPSSDGGATIIGYKVEYATSASDSFTLLPALATSTKATVTGLTNGTSYVFRVAAVNAAGTGPFSASSAAVTPTADTSALLISAPTSVRYGSTATIKAKLTDSTTGKALAKQPLTLYGRHATSGAWHALKSVTTSSTGAASFGLKPSSYEQFYWHFKGTATHKAVSSPARSVRVSQTVAVHATASRVKAKSLIKVYGTVAPSGSGQRVYLQVYSHGWKTVTSATLRLQTLPNRKRATGYVLGVRPAKGSKSYRVYKSATKTLLAGVSAHFTLAGK